MKDQELLDIFRALANENRQFIIFELFSDKNSYTVGEVAKISGLAQSTTSEHLSMLRRVGLLNSEKVNREVTYRVNKDTASQIVAYLEDWLNCC